MLDVANTILAQLGGGKFVIMTGAKDFIARPDSLTFKLPGGLTRDRGNRMTITLTQDDTYKVQYGRARMRNLEVKYTKLAELEDVYADNLRVVFEDLTGFRTSL